MPKVENVALKTVQDHGGKIQVRHLQFSLKISQQVITLFMALFH